jgi:phosphoserine phosphatase RsbU/P
MNVFKAIVHYYRRRLFWGSDLPLRTRWLIGGTGALVGGSFGMLAMKLTHRVHSNWPWAVASVGIGSVVVLQRLLRRQVMANFAMQKDEQAAEQIQTRLRPELLPQPPGYELAGFYRSFRHVGGDYYETMLLDDRRLLITIADVSGKGAGAALLTANLQAILKFVDLDERPLDQIAASINTHLCRHTEPGRFITMMMGVLDLESRRLIYVNAGHNPAMLRRSGGVERLGATSPPLGAIEGLVFPSAEAVMAPGDALVLYTDGLSERRNRGNGFFDENGIEAALNSNGHDSADAILRDLVQASETFSGGVPPDDDTAIVVIRVKEVGAG